MLLRLLTAACCAAFLSTGAFAQAPAPAAPLTQAPTAAPSSGSAATDTSARPPRGRRARAAAAAPAAAGPAAAAPAAADSTAAPAPGAARPAALPAGTKINVNTATAAQLDTLPSVGKARLKAIMDERAKSPFKDWDDFERRMQHTSVNKGVQGKIKDYIVF